MRRFRLKSFRAGLPGLSGEVEVRPADRDVLHPLFVVLRDKRALLYAPHGREDADFVTQSIEEIRRELTTALQNLEPDSPVGIWLEELRSATREYLDAVAASRGSNEAGPDFAPALAELRQAFREIAEGLGSRYRLPAALSLVAEMDAADHAAAALAPAEQVRELPPPAEPSPPMDASPPDDHEETTTTASADAQDDPLVRALDDPDDSVRFEAMSALGDRLEARLLPVIEPLLNDRDRYIRQYAVEYYAKLGPPDTTDRLIAALDDPDDSVRFEAMSALGDRLEARLLPVIEPLLNDRDRYIRQYAVEYYAKLGPR